MKDLVELKGNEIFATSLVIAEGTRNEHHSNTRIIRKYKRDFRDFKSINSPNGLLDSYQTEST